MIRKTAAKTAAGALALSIALLAAAPADAQGWGHRGYYRGGGWGGGGAAAAGIVGLATGAIIGGALASSQPYGYGPGYAYGPGYGPAPVYGGGPAYAGGGDAVAYCQSRFRSYDPGSGTYLGYDGMRHPCP